MQRREIRKIPSVGIKIPFHWAEKRDRGNGSESERANKVIFPGVKFWFFNCVLKKEPDEMNREQTSGFLVFITLKEGKFF